MQDAFTLSVTPLQALLALAFQAWIIIFPILIMRKVDRLTDLIESRLPDTSEENSDGESQEP
jgi:hypothetical protein